jgi:hypothetical protein
MNPYNSLINNFILKTGIRRFIQDLERDVRKITKSKLKKEKLKTQHDNLKKLQAIIYERQRFGSNASYNGLLLFIVSNP